MPKFAEPRPGEPIRLVVTRGGEPRYRVVLDAGTHASGKRRQVRSTHPTLTEARAHVAAHRTDRVRGVLLAPDRQSFADYAAKWHDRRSREVREVTASNYRAVIDRASLAFGVRALRSIERADVERLIAAMADAGRSKRTATLTLFVLRSIFEDAIDEKLIAANPARRVKPAGRPPVERQALALADVRKLRARLSKDRLYACWLLTLYGLRRSEVLGLRWSDIDLGARTLTVARGRVLLDGKRTVETPPKTKRGLRTLPLTDDVHGALRKLRNLQRAELGAEHVRMGYLAVNEVGGPVRHERWTDGWREHCAAAGVPAVTLHGARHSSVTAMRAAGVPDHLVAAWHGHDENTMRAVYTHTDVEGLVAAGNALAGALRGR